MTTTNKKKARRTKKQPPREKNPDLVSYDLVFLENVCFNPHLTSENHLLILFIKLE